jgi:uncharacterized protein (TIGR03067 family)
MKLICKHLLILQTIPWARLAAFNLLGICLLAAATVCAGPPANLKEFDGTWIPATAEMAGQSMPESVLKAITLKLDDGRYEVTVLGEQPDTGTFVLNPAAGPKAIKINGTKGPNTGKTFLAIYELKRDTLRVCYDLSGEKTPAEFKTSAGTKLYLVTYRRKATEKAQQGER